MAQAAQADPARIGRAFVELGVQFPLIPNHPTVQALGQLQEFQRDVRGQLDRMQQQSERLQQQFIELQQQLLRMQTSFDAMREESRSALSIISSEFVPYHTFILVN